MDRLCPVEMQAHGEAIQVRRFIDAERGEEKASKDPELVAFSQRVCVLREAAGMTQEALAHAAGLALDLHWADRARRAQFELKASDIEMDKDFAGLVDKYVADGGRTISETKTRIRTKKAGTVGVRRHYRRA